MASIIEFRKPTMSLRIAGSRPATAASADVVLFPGVRYERYAEEAPAKPRGRRSRRRDRLDLDD